jgi:hypothetical protein
VRLEGLGKLKKKKKIHLIRDGQACRSCNNVSQHGNGEIKETGFSKLILKC